MPAPAPPPAHGHGGLELDFFRKYSPLGGGTCNRNSRSRERDRTPRGCRSDSDSEYDGGDEAPRHADRQRDGNNKTKVLSKKRSSSVKTSFRGKLHNPAYHAPKPPSPSPPAASAVRYGKNLLSAAGDGGAKDRFFGMNMMKPEDVPIPESDSDAYSQSPRPSSGIPTPSPPGSPQQESKKKDVQVGPAPGELRLALKPFEEPNAAMVPVNEHVRSYSGSGNNDMIH